MKCQVVFRTRRGGAGLDYTTVRAEFLAVFGKYLAEIVHEQPGRYRLWAILELPPEQIARFAARLGYTEAVLAVHEEDYRGQSEAKVERGRWWQGWFRHNGRWVHQEAIYVQDEDAWRRESPHVQPVEVIHRGQVVPRVGHRAQRGLSPLDARFLFNITPLRERARVLDPFAGFGGLVIEGQRRGLQMFAVDAEPLLSPGLAQRAPGRYVIADARALPFRSASFDGIVTEPPFRTRFRQAVHDALPELQRVAPEGPITLFVARDMREEVIQRLTALGRLLNASYPIRRNRGLQCDALCFL